MGGRVTVWHFSNDQEIVDCHLRMLAEAKNFMQAVTVPWAWKTEALRSEILRSRSVEQAIYYLGLGDTAIANASSSARDISCQLDRVHLDVVTPMIVLGPSPPEPASAAAVDDSEAGSGAREEAYVLSSRVKSVTAEHKENLRSRLLTRKLGTSPFPGSAAQYVNRMGGLGAEAMVLE